MTVSRGVQLGEPTWPYHASNTSAEDYPEAISHARAIGTVLKKMRSYRSRGKRYELLAPIRGFRRGACLRRLCCEEQ
jgi:hypothetical protein